MVEKEEVPLQKEEQETVEKLSQETKAESEPVSNPLPQIDNDPKLRKTTSVLIKENEIDYEPIYNSLMEWLLLKTPASLGGAVMIDDTDKIETVDVLFIIIRLYKYVPEFIKQKVK